jgi:hypothetical protein
METMTNPLRQFKPFVWTLLAFGLSLCPPPCLAASDAPTAKAPTTNASASPDSDLYLKVQLVTPVKMTKLKPGDVIEGSLHRDVYSADHKAFTAGSHVRLTVDRLEKRRRARNDHWPWVVNVFTPRHENFPIFKTASVALPEGEKSLQVSMISASRLREVHAQAKKDKSKPQAAGDHSNDQASGEHGAVEVSKSNAKKMATPIMVLEASSLDDSAGATKKNDGSSEYSPAAPEALPAGTRCNILLLGDVSASKSKPGDVVRARLLEPVLVNSKLALPAGSLFEGRVLKKTPPRWLSRAGSLYLTFTELTLPDGNRVSITASLAGAELDARSHTRMDAEGQLRGERPGKAWMAINLGVSAGIAKEVDDGLQLILEAIVSTATDASTAGTSRIVASCISGLYMVTRHGRDVVLPRFTEMNISLDRPVSITPAPQPEPSTVAAGGK